MEFQAEIIRAIQSVATPALDIIFQAITMLGEDFFIIFVATFIYWCFNKEMGYWMCWCLSFGNLLVSTVKIAVKLERPIGYEGIRTLREHTAPGYSFPSGHTHACANFFTSIARAVNRRRFWAMAIIVPALVGLSRLYLGVHWPVDVIGGYAIGIALPLVLWLFYRKYARQKALMFLISTAAFLPLGFILGGDNSFWKSFGFALGIAIGAFIETKFINFEIDDVPAKKKALRYIGGIILILIVYLGMKAVLPVGPVYSFIRYFCLPLAAIALWPAIFKKYKF
ncbi:MAG: phosphatase PAP2 family protein [Oscillospiraceae bacterium]|nr:phosphatase PAP2 family protein [Oscillospiraceae bacterium]MBR3610550.1 phosphatase PAP2 family protein [Oscillospiraceae bacterium]